MSDKHSSSTVGRFELKIIKQLDRQGFVLKSITTHNS